MLNDLPARGYASHGESWSFALSLKLASAALLRAESQLGDPVVVLDDVFAELDESRRAQLAAAIGDYEQVLITAAVLGDVPPELAGHTVHIRAGRDRGGGVVSDGTDRRADDAEPAPEKVPEHIAVYQRIRSVFGDPSLRSGDARRRKRAARDEIERARTASAATRAASAT